ncbi:uncharacterized protein PGTG_14951 [Puccinia graminis f. sp. tritici CRL 75-36-700-3]|uniref:RecQ-mediated genome instability protein 1 n=1 Tax=Puccinia graminis f. sp. tritici (strain CRL 75-36-700-3 / race SCCL) TaxID=418459 RepID=E3KXP8_PUCGT|nr:uncharacterized protein PGTG_14951 [Puccinia graminis f. sp. tritici CRL 75-36-700-3]EFP89110.2 hypothetical protein PGTG_14951 [Puccinia graminis f. sp. tritici CRL 75-36-700-3]
MRPPSYNCIHTHLFCQQRSITHSPVRMADSVVPRAVRNWFRTTYPTLVFEETWLTQCCEYLQTHFDLTPPQLIKKIENQLLLSDLSTSTSAETPPLKDLWIPEQDAERQTKVQHLPNRGILVQIQSITEIGHSALSLRTVHQKLIDDAQGRDRVLDLEDPESQDRQAPILYPRAMLKFDLSDGHHTIPAIEYQKIDGLSLAETPLGCKLLIKSATIRRGLLLLTSENTTIKGFQVDELDLNRDRILQEGLNARLSRAADNPERNDDQQAMNRIPNGNGVTNSSATSFQSASIVNTHDPSSVTQPRVIVDLSDSDNYFDDNSDFEAQLLAHDI